MGRRTRGRPPSGQGHRYRVHGRARVSAAPSALATGGGGGVPCRSTVRQMAPHPDQPPPPRLQDTPLIRELYTTLRHGGVRPGAPLGVRRRPFPTLCGKVAAGSPRAEDRPACILPIGRIHFGSLRMKRTARLTIGEELPPLPSSMSGGAPATAMFVGGLVTVMRDSLFGVPTRRCPPPPRRGGRGGGTDETTAPMASIPPGSGGSGRLKLLQDQSLSGAFSHSGATPLACRP